MLDSIQRNVPTISEINNEIANDVLIANEYEFLNLKDISLQTYTQHLL